MSEIKSPTKEEIEKAFEDTNFGSATREEILADSLLKYSCGYCTGHTATRICIELNLISSNTKKLTKKGKSFLYELIQSERQARFQVKKELEDLQDAILDKFLSDPMDPDKFKILMNAMKQSMERAKQ